MLVLTRKLDESILIGDGVEVKVVGIKGTGDQAVIRIGIVAPKDVTILRRELYEEVVAANQEAAKGSVVPADVLAGVAPRETGKKPSKGPKL